jgi:DNA-binding beta-propeller fold protein YncE
VALGYTHGVVVDAQQRVYVFNQSQHAVLIFEPDGTFAGSWSAFPSDRFLGAHGLTLVGAPPDEFLWLTDQNSGEVVKTTLAGETVLPIDKPDHPVYRQGGKYSPTWATESPADGTIYVADGYGSGLVNRYDERGAYLDSFDGSTGLGSFRCPHGIACLRRPHATGVDDWVLYITDRGNARVQVFDRQLQLLSAWYQDHPCCFAPGPDGELLVPDLHAFVNVYDRHDRPLLTRLGDNQAEIVKHEGWPNVPHELRTPGRFNSPHGGAMDRNGNIYIVEWIADGRITKLTAQ